MRTQPPHASSQRDGVVGPGGGDGTAAPCFPGRGLCCPDDPLDLVLQLFPAASTAADPPSSLAALGIGGGGGAGGDPPRPVKQEPESPQPVDESACGGGGVGVGGAWDSWGLSSLVLDGLSGLDEIDVDMFFADDALDDGGAGEAAEANLLCDATEAKPEPPAAHMAAAPGGGPVPVHTGGSLGGAVVVPNDASPRPAPIMPLPAGAFPLQANDACRAFDCGVPNNASPPPPATAAPMPAGGPPPVFVNSNSTPPLPALITPAAGLHACTAFPGIVSNSAPAPPPPLMAPMCMPPAAGLHACAAFPGIVSNCAPSPPPLMAPMLPARALLHPDAAALAGVYSSNYAPVHASPSATPSSSPPSGGASSGSGLCPSSATSEPEFLQPHHAWIVVPRKQRSAPAANRRKRPWLLDFPLRALPPVAVAPPPPPPANPGGANDGGGNDDDDAKNLNAVVLPLAFAPPGNTGGDDIAAAVAIGAVTTGGVRRRRPAPRQRNRQAQRVCSHCHSPETPQWRAGPDGPGTLCNACGIRYAANRLLPEYRPSTAPSFRSGQHSNRHRKVMKLREQQMMKGAPATEEKPPPSDLELEQPMIMEDGADAKKDDDDGFIGVCTYISSAPGLL